MQGDGNGIRLCLFRGTYCAYWRETKPNGKTWPRRASLRTADRAEAECRFRDFLKSFTASPGTIADIFSDYLREKEGTGGHRATTFSWKALAPQFGALRPDQVTREECRAYTAARREKGISNGTINRDLTMLRAALNWHDKETKAVFEMPTKPPPRERYLTRKEYAKLLAAAVTPHVRLFIILALSTAGRRSAILELTWDRVDLDRGVIRLAKGGESRMKGRATVPITVTAHKALLEAKAAALSEYVIEHGGGKIDHIEKALGRTAVRAGLKDVTPHVLRHTAAVWMAEARVPMSEISQYLGHTDSRITERVYARFSPEYLRRAARALETSARSTPKKTPPSEVQKRAAKAIA